MEEPTDIRERLIWVISNAVGTTHRYPYLEKRTGISARKWKNVCNRVQQPSIEMLAALAKELRPAYLEWMVHGTVFSSHQADPREEQLDDGSWAHPELRGMQRTLPPSTRSEAETDEMVEAFFSGLKGEKRAPKK